MILTAILATDCAGAIGQGAGLPWPKMSRDMQRFKAATTGKVCLVGRRTWATLPPLPGRRLAVLSALTDLRDLPGDRPIHRLLRDPAEVAPLYGAEPEVMVIGGADIYRQLLPRCDRLLLTVVHGEYPADVRLDDPTAGFVQLDSETHDPDEHTPARLTFSTWARRV